MLLLGMAWLAGRPSMGAALRSAALLSGDFYLQAWRWVQQWTSWRNEVLVGSRAV